jgi:hypothetical protein
MANIQSTRRSLREWFAKQIRIDEWDADAPTKLFAANSSASLPLPACTAIEYPVKDLGYKLDGLATIYGTGSFTFSIVYRYSGHLKIDQLPLSRVEAVAQYLHAMSLLSLGGVEGIQSASPDIEEYPVQISRVDDDQGDWLIFIHIVLLVDFSLTELSLPPEFQPPGYDGGGNSGDIDRLSLEVWRGKSGKVATEKTLDYSQTLEINTERG